MLRLHQQYSLYSRVAVMKSFPIDFSPTRGGACIIGSTVSTGLQRWTRSGLPDLIDGPFLNLQKHIGLECKMQLIASQAWLPGKWCCPCYHLGSCILLCCTLFTGEWNALNDIEMHISALQTVQNGVTKALVVQKLGRSLASSNTPTGAQFGSQISTGRMTSCRDGHVIFSNSTQYKNLY